MRVVISGQKYFAENVFRLCEELDIEVVAVCCPIGDKYIGKKASISGCKIIPSGSLNVRTMPDGVDLGITAHSHDFIGSGLRAMTKHGWIGFHPSILPRHRGRSSMEWALRFKDFMIGGTTYWLNSGVDRGDISRQKIIFTPERYLSINPTDGAGQLWRDVMQDIGIALLREDLMGIKKGEFLRVKQDEAFATFEPRCESQPIYRPDSLALPEHKKE
jgi:methionyl-tRNA formyltransferase